VEKLKVNAPVVVDLSVVMIVVVAVEEEETGIVAVVEPEDNRTRSI
jgi:hypothetical protein